MICRPVFAAGLAAVGVLASAAGAQDSAPSDVVGLLTRGLRAEAAAALRQQAADPATAAARLATMIEPCGAEAALDLWLEVADEAAARRPGDAALAFYIGTVRSDLQQLRVADAAFARAVAIDPAAVGPRLARAQIAARRFDAAGAIAAARGIDAPAAEQIRTEQAHRLDQSPAKAQAFAAVIGAVIFALVIAGALRLGPRDGDARP